MAAALLVGLVALLVLSPSAVAKTTMDVFLHDKPTFHIAPESKIANLGEVVVVNVTVPRDGANIPHDFTLDEFAGAKSDILQPGQSMTVTFTADKPGQFEYYCSVPGHREAGMVGVLTVIGSEKKSDGGDGGNDTPASPAAFAALALASVGLLAKRRARRL